MYNVRFLVLNYFFLSFIIVKVFVEWRRKLSGKSEIAIEKLIKYFSVYYNIEKFENVNEGIVARCDFFEHSQKYVLSEKAELWSADSEEFVYIISVSHLTEEIYKKYLDKVVEDGKQRMHIGPGHMYSFITPIFIVDTADSLAVKLLKKCRIYKSFHFSLHGWMDVRTTLVILNDSKLYANMSGRSVLKIMKKVLYSTLRKERQK